MSLHKPRLSIVVIIYNMQREAPRTLFSLSDEFQRDVDPGDYEVIVVDNGSTEPLDPSHMPWPNFRYCPVADANPSPAAAINYGVSLSDANAIGIMIDGARIASPGAIALALDTLTRFERPIVSTLGFHLGPDLQCRSIEAGYDRDTEDALLRSIQWRHNGYRLFEISAFADSSRFGWIGGVAESNLLFMPTQMFEELGGFEERFDIPGGGLVNLDFYRRACELRDSTLVQLLSEATFHQVHGGEMANQTMAEVGRRLVRYGKQYREIRGADYEKPDRPALIYGPMRPEVVNTMRQACENWLA